MRRTARSSTLPRNAQPPSAAWRKPLRRFRRRRSNRKISKIPSMFTIVGKPTKRVDTRKKVNGTAGFGVDVRLPGMLHAVVSTLPCLWRQGRELRRYESESHFRRERCRSNHDRQGSQEASGWRLAVVADNTWTAMQGRKALDIQWNEGPNAGVSNATIFKSFADACERPASFPARRATRIRA